MTPLASSDFGRMLSVDAIRFEDRFYASRKGRTGGGGWIHRSAGGLFVCFLAKTSVENAPFTLYRDSISGNLGSF